MQFEYLKPVTIGDAKALLKQYKGEVKIIAGGTDLMLQMRSKTVSPKFVVDITGIPELNTIVDRGGDGLSIGALVTMSDLQESTLINQKYTVLSQAAANLGSVAIRNVATVGGNLCNALPSAETSQALLALGAKVRIVAADRADKIVDLEQFFTGSGKNILQPDELLAEILVSAPAANSRGIYFKHVPRGSIDLAIVNLAVVLSSDPHTGLCRDIKIAMGAVGATPLRAKKTEELLRSKKIDDALIEKAAMSASEEANPRAGSIRGSVRYKKAMIKVLLKRALKALTA